MGAALLLVTVSFSDRSGPARNPGPQHLRQLSAAMDFGGAQEILQQAHHASLDGNNDFAELRELFRVFQSTSPDMREFAVLLIYRLI